MTAQELQSAFQQRLEQHKRILYKVCHAYCRDPDSREDLAQEITLQLWRAFPNFDGRCQFSTWMYRISLNVAISFLRRESTRNRWVVSDYERLLTVVDPAECPSEELRTLHEYIAAMDPLQKALILLYLDGSTYPEIAAIVGISETNVATRISRLKGTMKQKFS